MVPSSVIYCQMFILAILLINPGRVSLKDRKRPFYNLAHMANSVEDLNVALANGANGIEFDVRFDPEGEPTSIYHGYICDCLRDCSQWTNFTTFIQYIHDLTNPNHEKFNSNFTFAFVDLKTGDFASEFIRLTAGQKLFHSLAKHLFNFGKVQTRVKLLLSLMTTYDEFFIIGFMDEMKNKNLQVINQYIGWDISNGEALGAIKFMYEKLSKTYDLHIWQSDGITNCISMLVPRDRITSAVQIRKSPLKFMAKVCLWTVDVRSHIREALRIGVDSILTNNPANFIAVLNEKEFSNKYRLADSNDNPWIRFEGD